MTNQNKSYGLFNGRRDADQYVKGYLKGTAIISGTALTILILFSTWVSNKIYSHEMRITTVESNRFTVEDGNAAIRMIHDNTVKLSGMQSFIASITKDLDEIKSLLRRSAPYERRSNIES